MLTFTWLKELIVTKLPCCGRGSSREDPPSLYVYVRATPNLRESISKGIRKQDDHRQYCLHIWFLPRCRTRFLFPSEVVCSLRCRRRFALFIEEPPKSSRSPLLPFESFLRISFVIQHPSPLHCRRYKDQDYKAKRSEP